MLATPTLPQPVARSLAPFMPPPSPPAAFRAPPPAVRRAVAPRSAAALRLERARWCARVRFASVLVAMACAAVGVAHSRPGGELLAAGGIALGGVALEGWRRARSLRSEVSSLRSALGAARETERWHRAVVDDVSDAVLVASPEGRMMEMNQAATVLLGRDREWLMGRRLWDLLPLDDRLVALRRGDMAATHGGGLRRLLRPDGSTVAADVSWSTLDDGRMIYLARRFGQW